MKKPLKIILIAIAAAALVVCALWAVSRVVFHRSLMASAAELFLRCGGVVKNRTVEETEAYLEERRKNGDEPFSLPAYGYESEVSRLDGYGCEVVVFSGSDEPKRTVIYMHGGAYVSEITVFHTAYCDRLARAANARVIVPIYPLAPNHTYKETYDIVTRIYLDEKEKALPITLMGDSAGGGFAAAFAEYLASSGLPLPSSLVLFSPWVDVSMSGDRYDELAAVDPMVERDRVIPAGRAWAGDTDTRDPMISPLFGDMTGLPPTLVYVGTREILLCDVEAFYDKLIEAGVTAKLVVGEGMNHVYPVFPIPEAEAALEETAEFIRSAK